MAAEGWSWSGMVAMRRLISLICALAGLLSCSAGNIDGGVQTKPDGDRPYRLTVDGKPFLMLGAQLRTDFFRQLDGRGLDQLDDYFALAAGLNITCVQAPISWRDIEPEYGVYSDEVVKAFIDYCNKYGLKLEILWFGSYMCGYSVEGHIPDYVVSDSQTYPELNPSAAYQGWQGKQYFLSPGNTKLVERESRAISKMMEFIAEYDRSIGSPHTVIGIQVENEPDMLATRHNAAHGYSPTDLWPSLLYHIDQVGKAVKNGPYDCYTRVNQTTTYPDWVYWSTMVAKREGVDYVGFDPYVNDVAVIGDWLSQVQAIPGNFSHIAENGGEFYNNDILTLKALVSGCGYEVFEVITTPHPYLKDWTLRGVYNPDFTPKGQTQRLIDAFSIYKAAWYDFATADLADMVGFNIQSSEGKTVAEESLATSSVTVDWQTSARGIAFAIQGKGYLTVGSTKDDTMSVSFEPARIESGHYDKDGNWIVESSGISYEGSLSLFPCKVYKLYF